MSDIVERAWYCDITANPVGWHTPVECGCQGCRAAAEIERLRHDIERYVAIANEHATENERLRAEVAILRPAPVQMPGGADESFYNRVKQWRDDQSRALDALEQKESSASSVRCDLCGKPIEDRGRCDCS